MIFQGRNHIKACLKSAHDIILRPYEEQHGGDAPEAVGEEAGEDDPDQEAEEGRLLSQLPDEKRGAFTLGFLVIPFSTIISQFSWHRNKGNV